MQHTQTHRERAYVQDSLSLSLNRFGVYRGARATLATRLNAAAAAAAPGRQTKGGEGGTLFIIHSRTNHCCAHEVPFQRACPRCDAPPRGRDIRKALDRPCLLCTCLSRPPPGRAIGIFAGPLAHGPQQYACTFQAPRSTFSAVSPCLPVSHPLLCSTPSSFCLLPSPHPPASQPASQLATTPRPDRDWVASQGPRLVRLVAGPRAHIRVREEAANFGTVQYCTVPTLRRAGLALGRAGLRREGDLVVEGLVVGPGTYCTSQFSGRLVVRENGR